MSQISRELLYGKLNKIASEAMHAAILFSKGRGDSSVELIHWIHQLIQAHGSDLHHILEEFRIDAARLAGDLVRALDKLDRPRGETMHISEDLDEVIQRAWVFASVLFGRSKVRSGHVLLAALSTDHLRKQLLRISGDFGRIDRDELASRFAAIVESSPENALDVIGAPETGAQETAAEPSSPLLGSKSSLKRFAVDLTERARLGELDPVVGRDHEMRQLVDILMRRRQNNPILTGEAGVGKTAVVENLALRIAAGDVPPPLRDVSLVALDIGLLQAGASIKGEFEQRLRQVIDEVQASEKPIILFVDEAHTLIGAGGSKGTGDAANLLKPALARGTLRTIAATTWAEYKEHIEPDPALTRRFQVVQVHEPEEDTAVRMMRAVATTMERHHQVQLLDEALDAAVRLSRRYIPARQLPDKAVSLLDTACARVAISQHAVPAEVEDCRRTIEALETELAIIEREHAVGEIVDERRQRAQVSLESERKRLETLERRWQSERGLVERILELRATLRAGAQPVDSAPAETPSDGKSPTHDPAEREKLLGELRGLQAELTQLQGERPLILPTVDAQAVAAVISDWTGIPTGRMVRDEAQAVLDLARTLGSRVIGQDHALEKIAERIQTSRVRLENPNRPIGVFLLAGPSGVGKTETALALSEALYGGEHNVITINMSEYQEAHTVSSLKGAPPGYVGYGKGGVLTEAVRRRPYSVVLLDEVEKAHKDVHEVFFQVFDKGFMEDGTGRVIDFKNTLILLTSNVGTDEISTLCGGEPQSVDLEQLTGVLQRALLRVFPPALLGRMVKIPYFPLSNEMVASIARLQLGRLGARLQEQHQISFEYDDKVLSLINDRCTERESGARAIDAIITGNLLPRISKELLSRMIRDEAVSTVAVTARGGEFDCSFS